MSITLRARNWRSAVDRLVIDASVVIASLLPDEPYRTASLRILKEFLSGNLELFAVPLLRFEITNALWKAISRGRTKLNDAQAALREFEAFNLPEREVATQEILRIAHTYNLSAYDAAYLTLAASEQIPLITADNHLYNAVKGRSHLVLWVEDFK
jgi:predicted nucleic acid-binding protein